MKWKVNRVVNTLRNLTAPPVECAEVRLINYTRRITANETQSRRICVVLIKFPKP